MDGRQQTNGEQAVLWNGVAGRTWIDAQALLDGLFEPLENWLAAAAAERGGRVLDVGCGTGSTTLAAARALGTRGRCTGIDISAPMIAVARQRAAREATPVDFIDADAQLYPFEPASFDLFISRFGIMFFDDPVAAFANLRRAARDDAELLLLAWRSAADNPFMTTAERAAGALLPPLPAHDPHAPGQFAFADPHRVRRILEGSHWMDADIQPVDFECSFPAAELVRYFTMLGPVGRALHDVDAATRARVVEKVRVAFEPYVQGAEVRFNAACWAIVARAAPMQGVKA